MILLHVASSAKSVYRFFLNYLLWDAGFGGRASNTTPTCIYTCTIKYNFCWTPYHLKHVN